MTRAGWVTAAVVAAVVVVGAFLLFRPTGPDGAVYVALGDSYASGTGTSVGDEEENECRRSEEAHAHLLAERAGLAGFAFPACSGATTADLLAGQLEDIGEATTLVTVTIGGNDVGFTRALRVCALTPESTDCTGQLAEAKAIIAALPARVAEVVAAVRERAPEARVFVTGYPLLLAQEVADGTAACAIATVDVPAALATAANDINRSLNAAVAAGVEEAGDRAPCSWTSRPLSWVTTSAPPSPGSTGWSSAAGARG